MATSIDLDRLAADVVARLEARGAQRHGDELRYRCLSDDHEDANPSAAYNVIKKAHKCQGCGISGGLIVGDHPIALLLGFDPEHYRSNNGSRPHDKKVTATSSWDIRDPDDGQVVAVHHRRDLPDGGKTLWWSRNGESGLNGMKVADLPLYAAARLSDREPGDDTPVMLVEGEKAADALLELGLMVVGSVTGASSIPARKALSVLAGRNVVCWPDADDIGRKHMSQIAERLTTMVSSVRIFSPAGLPKGGDAIEWVAAHDGVDGLVGVLLEAVETEAVAPAELQGALRDDVTEDVSVALEDFHAYMPMHSYIFAPCREMWPAASVNSRIPAVPLLDANQNHVFGDNDRPMKIKANVWLDQNQPVEQMTWAPGMPMLIRDRLISEGGWIDRKGCTCFNLYRPPHIVAGDASKAGPWLDHVQRVYGDDADHIVSWLAHRVQRPEEKINHALVLGGLQGVGKDTLLEPVKRAIGPWNFTEVSPVQMLGRFNGWVKSVILRVSEARDLGDVDRYRFYDHLKVYTAAPPDVLRVDEKNLREYAVFNVCGVVITTNHKADGVYLPADDRRHYVAWSSLTKDDFPPDYWNKLYTWYGNEGDRHVAAYLQQLDLTRFDPKAPPPKTPAFWDSVDANRAPEDAELADALDKLCNPAATTLTEITSHAGLDFGDWLRDRKNRRQIPHRFEDVGYVSARNPDAKDGLWKLGGRRQVIYVRNDLLMRDRIAAAQAHVEGAR